MYILYDGDSAEPFVELWGTHEDMVYIGNRLAEISNEIEIEAEPKESDIYPENLDSVIFREISKNDEFNLLNISIFKNKLLIEGTSLALRKLRKMVIHGLGYGQVKGAHIHLDYFEGNQIVALTKVSLVIASDTGLD